MPIVITPRGIGSQRAGEAGSESAAGASRRRQKARDAGAGARRIVNGVSVAAMVIIEAVGIGIAAAVDREPLTPIVIAATFEDGHHNGVRDPF